MALAREEYSKGITSRASWFGWEAALMMVKAVADSRGLEHADSRAVYSAVGRFSNEAQDQRLRQLFSSAGVLRSNYYDNFLDIFDVGAYLENVSEFVDKMDAL